MDVFSDKSTLGLTSLPGSSPTRERGWVRPIYQQVLCWRVSWRDEDATCGIPSKTLEIASL